MGDAVNDSLPTDERVSCMFDDIAIGESFVWARSPELGPMRKCGTTRAVDLDGKFHLIHPDEDVVQ